MAFCGLSFDSLSLIITNDYISVDLWNALLTDASVLFLELKSCQEIDATNKSTPRQNQKFTKSSNGVSLKRENARNNCLGPTSTIIAYNI